MKNLLEKKQEITESINSMKKGSYEQMWLITMYGLESYFKSLLKFGNTKITKDNLIVIKEMFSILSTERQMLNFILKNLDSFEINATLDVVQMLDQLNDKTVEYYYSVIEEIEDAVDMGDIKRGKRPIKNFPTLIQTNNYTNQVKALALNKEAIKEFLGYESAFWEYIEGMDKSSVRVPSEGHEALDYAYPLYDENKNVIGLKFYITEIADLGSALIAIKTYEKAYGIYKCLGKKYDPEDITLEIQEEFENNYLPRLDKNSLIKK